MTLPRLGDNDNRTVALLEEVVRQLGGNPQTAGEETYNIDEGDTIVNPNGEFTGYFTTGPSGITVTDAGSTYEEIEFGGEVGTINVRTDVDIHVAFSDPHNNPGRLVPISSTESPFTIGGSNPIAVDTLFVQKQNDGDADAEVHVIAY